MPVRPTGVREKILHPDVSALDLATIMRHASAIRCGWRSSACWQTATSVAAATSQPRSPCPRSTGSYHLRLLREAGVTRTRADGTLRLISLRREDLEARFPGLVDVLSR